LNGPGNDYASLTKGTWIFVAMGQARTLVPQQTNNKTQPVLQVGPLPPANTALLSGEAIEQSVPTGATEVALAATTIGPARGMR
jgi:hypothetical protein